MLYQKTQTRPNTTYNKKPSWFSYLLVAGLFVSPTFQANANLHNPSATGLALSESPYSEQRERYQQAMNAFRSGNYSEFTRLSRKLKDYPLYPYLVYRSLNHNLERQKPEILMQFMQSQDESVVGDWMRTKLISHYANTHEWQALIDVYRPGFGIDDECRYLRALINTGKGELAYPRIQTLWLSPSSRPDSCDPVFSQWEKQGLRTTDMVWQRFRLAIMDNNHQLAVFIARALEGDDATTAQLWIKLHRNPQAYTLDDLKKIKHPQQESMLVHWLKRLSSRDLDKAIAYYHKLKSEDISEAHIAELTRRIGLKMARRHIPDASIWLARIPDTHVDKAVSEWRIRTAIRQGDWSMVTHYIGELSQNEQGEHRWQFWWAYANEEMGNSNDALGIYQYLSTQRSYYGFLAADRLGTDYDFEDRPLSPDEKTMAYVRQQPETRRALEFFLMNKLMPARREWHHLINRLDTQQKLAASKLAQLWGWHDRAIVTMGKTRYRDDIELRFPLHYNEKVKNWSAQHKVDPAWTYAIIRRESAFITDARSSVGAVGLMQLMPNTARHTAKYLKINYTGTDSLLASNTNIQLGTGYLGQMLQKLDQQVLATAAYNAGPHRVAAWLPEDRDMDAMRWIETIPFTETREYVSNVLAYMVIYEHRMQRNITRLSQRMPPVPAKNAPAVAQSQPQSTDQASRQATPHGKDQS